MSKNYSPEPIFFKPVIFISPLDWGLGHATRCIPIIRHLLSIDCQVIIGGNELIESVLKPEFPSLEFLEMPSYNVTYASSRRRQSFALLLQALKILTLIKKERLAIKNLLAKRRIDGIISDNRFGCFDPSIPSVIITHQLAVRSPFGPAGHSLSRILNYRFLRKFQECWIPDTENSMGLAGILSHPPIKPPIPVRYLGPLSRMKPPESKINWDILLLLSGPEPQRTLLEKKLRDELAHSEKRIILVRGLPSGKTSSIYREGNFDIADYLTSDELIEVISASALIVSRSGYTTVMDLAAMRKPAHFIPTPGQPEQEYLAVHLSKQGYCTCSSQENFKAEDLFQNRGLLPEPQSELFTTVLTDWVEKLKT